MPQLAQPKDDRRRASRRSVVIPRRVLSLLLCALAACNLSIDRVPTRADARSDSGAPDATTSQDAGAVPAEAATGIDGGGTTCADCTPCTDCGSEGAACRDGSPRCDTPLVCGDEGSCVRLPDDCLPAPEERPVCSTVGGCAKGFVCHVDGTCIEPGKCDARAWTTLGEYGPDSYLRDVRIGGAHAYWHYVPRDALGNQAPARIVRTLLAGGEVQLVIDDVGQDVSMHVDDESLFIFDGFEPGQTRLWEWQLDTLKAPTDPIYVAGEHACFAFTADAVVVGDGTKLARLDRHTHEVLAELAMPAARLGACAADATRAVFAHAAQPYEPIPLYSWTFESAAYTQIGDGPIFFVGIILSDGHPYYQAQPFMGGIDIGQISETAALDPTYLYGPADGSSTSMRAWGADLYFAQSATTELGAGIVRVPKTPGTPRLLIKASAGILALDVNEPYLVWAEAGRIVRAPRPE